MTYTLFEWAKENLETLLEAQPESLIVEAMERVQVITKSHTLVINIVTVVYYVQGGFFDWSGLKITKCQALWKIELF